MNKIFGTDGIRGIANIYPMTSEIALTFGRAVAFKARQRSARPKIIVGKDTRLSCYMIEMAVVSGICSMGADALMTGPIPTPGIAYLTRDMRRDAGIMITASHNPYEDNGIKLFGPDGFKLSDQEEKELEECILSHRTTDELISIDNYFYPKAHLIGKAFKIEDARGRYIAHLKQAFPSNLDLCGMRIALDCANGAAYKIAPTVFRELGAEVEVIGDKPNGININDNCGALHSRKLEDEIIAYKNTGLKFDIGFAFDGDADRLVVIDENGDKVNGDAILALAHCSIQHNAYLHMNLDMVTTTMSNYALGEFVRACGGNMITTDVGDKYVIEEMKLQGTMIGGEQSGHIIYADHSTTGDGIVAALKLLGYMRDWEKIKNEKAIMSKYAQIIKLYPQCMINVDVKEKIPIEDIPNLKDAIDKAYWTMEGQGRIIVRNSGTENKLRILVEHKEKTTADNIAETIAKIVRDNLK